MKILDVSAVAMQSDLQRLAGISRNLANVQTPGFKRSMTVQHPFGTEWESAATRLATSVDMSTGPVRATRNPLDVTIDGDGFFVVRTPNGPAYTRQAALHLDHDGRVVNASGLAVEGDRGELRTAAGASDVRIDAKGELWSQGKSIGRLQVARLGEIHAMSPLGDGLFQASPSDRPQTIEEAKVLVGYQEGSNVNSSTEMVALLETSRHFEAVSRAIQAYDESVGEAMRKLGDF